MACGAWEMRAIDVHARGRGLHAEPHIVEAFIVTHLKPSLTALADDVTWQEWKDYGVMGE